MADGYRLSSEESLLRQEAVKRMRAAELDVIFWRRVADCLARHDPDLKERPTDG